MFAKAAANLGMQSSSVHLKHIHTSTLGISLDFICGQHWNSANSWRQMSAIHFSWRRSTLGYLAKTEATLRPPGKVAIRFAPVKESTRN